jgi:hypothetical protein
VWIALDDEASRRSACFVQNFSSCQCARAVAGVRLHVGQATGAGMHERSTYVALHGARKHGEEQLLLAARWPREPHNGTRLVALHAFTAARYDPARSGDCWTSLGTTSSSLRWSGGGCIRSTAHCGNASAITCATCGARCATIQHNTTMQHNATTIMQPCNTIRPCNIASLASAGSGDLLWATYVPAG